MTVNGQASSSQVLTGLTPNQLYKFRIRAKNSLGINDSNTVDQTVTMNLAPDAPNDVDLQVPSYTPAMLATPTIRVSGVKNGDTIKLYTDPTCNPANEVASAVATGSSIDLTTSSLAAGTYAFYARSVNSASNASACSTATDAYTRNQCPTNYLAITHNTTAGTTADFCVMKYEARAMKNDTSTLDADGCGEAGCTTGNWASLYHPVSNTSGYRPVSVPDGQPWRQISQTQAKTACSNLGTGYALISNPEWMTIALSAEQVPANWSNGNAGDGVLNRGYVNGSNTAPASSSQASCLYYTGANSCGTSGTSDYKRTLITAIGSTDEIWDFSGNVWDWVDWNVTPAEKAYQSGAGNDLSVDRGWKEWSVINMKIGGSDEMKPETWESAFFPTLNGANGLGRYYAGVNTSGGAALRGGSWSNGTYAGAFALYLSSGSSATSANIGFRCVFRP